MYKLKDGTVVDLCHPELLSSSVLLSLLKERNVKDIECLNKDELIEKFNRIWLPLPQRRRFSLRRPEVKAAQHKDETVPRVVVPRPRAPISGFQAPPLPSSGVVKEHKMLNVAEPRSRLKPPPIVSGKKVIKLNSKASNGTAAVDSLKRCSAAEEGGAKKIIRLTSAPSSNSTSVADSKVAAHNNEEELPPKKKHKPILWP